MNKFIVLSLGLILVAGFIGGVMASAGCSNNAGASDNVAVNRSFDGKEIELAVGGLLAVTLDSNITTGFQWALIDNSNEQILPEFGHDYVNPENGDSQIVGTGGLEVWTFKALEKGVSRISMEYSQPWNGGTKGAETFELTVIIK